MFLAHKEREFRKAYQRYYPLIINKIFMKVGNVDDAEDICHELFITFYKKFDEVQDPGKWLFSAIRYEILNHYKKKELKGGAAVHIDDVENDPNLAFENGFRDIRIVINEAIGNDGNYKDELDRTVFNLVAVNNYTYGEAARQLGLSTRQVEYRYAQTIKRILAYLNDRGIANIGDLL